MRTELFIKEISNETGFLTNANFANGLSGWSGGTLSRVYGNAVYLNGDAVNGKIYQDDIVFATGNYKLGVTVSPPIDPSEALQGFGRVSIGNTFVDLSSVGTHTFYLTVAGLPNRNLILSASGALLGGTKFNGGLTNITIEGTSGDYKNVSLYDDVDIPLTYNIADIKNIDKRNSSYSKTIKMPATNENNKLFRHIYNITSDGAFIMNKPVDCYIKQDTYTIFEGAFELLKCNIRNDEVHYEGVVYSKTSEFFIKLGNKKLTGNDSIDDNITFYEYNHIYNVDNIVNSFTTTPGSGYTYVPIDKTDRRYYVSEPRLFKTEEMSPALFIKEIWDKIFEKAGFTYESEFLTSDYFKRLIYPFTDAYMRLDEDDRLSRSFSGKGGGGIEPILIDPATSTFPPYYGEMITDYMSWTILSNGSLEPFSNDVPSGGKFTCKASGHYNIDIKYKYKSRIYVPVGWFVYPNYAWTVKTNEVGYVVESKVILRRAGGAETTLETRYNHNHLPQFIPMSGRYSVEPICENELTYSNSLFLGFGDEIIIRRRVLLPWRWSTVYTEWLIQDTTGFDLAAGITMDTVDAENNFFKVESTNILSENCLVKLDAILHDVKQSDFIINIIKMFNLYLEPISENKFLIETRDDYYNIDTAPLDWTNKVDLFQDIKIERGSDLIENIVNFKYKFDGDWYSTSYNVAFPLQYGEFYRKYERNIDDKKLNKFESIFATCPNAPITTGSKIEVPKLFKYSDDWKIIQTFKFSPRILWWGGLMSGSGETFKVSNMAGTDVRYYFNMYPYCGHLDGLYGNEENDLMFASNDWYWSDIGYPPTWVTANNLINKYYGNMFAEYLDDNTKIVTMKLNLQPTDLENLKFYNIIFIDGVYYRLNKITDYAPNKLTEVQFQKFKKQDITFPRKPINIITKPEIPALDNLTQTRLYIDIIDGVKDNYMRNEFINIDVVDAGSAEVAIDPRIADSQYLFINHSDVYVDIVNNSDTIDPLKPRIDVYEMKNNVKKTNTNTTYKSL